MMLSAATSQLDSNTFIHGGRNNGTMVQISLLTTASASEMEPETEQEGPAILERACYWRRMLNAHSHACSSGEEEEDRGQQNKRFSPRRGQGLLVGRGGAVGVGVRAKTSLRTTRYSEEIIPSPYRRRAAVELFSPNDQSVVSFSGSADGKRSMNEGSSRAILSALEGVGGGGGAASMDALFRQYAPRFAHTNTAENTSRRGGGGSPGRGDGAATAERRASSVSSTISHRRPLLTAASEAEALRRKKAEEAARRLLMGTSGRGVPATGTRGLGFSGAAKDARSSSRGPSTTGIASSSLVSSLLMRNKAGKNTVSPFRDRAAVATASSVRRGDHPQSAVSSNQSNPRMNTTSAAVANGSLGVDMGVRRQGTTTTLKTMSVKSGKEVATSSSTPRSSLSRTSYGGVATLGGRAARKSISPPSTTTRMYDYGGLGAPSEEEAHKEEYVVSLRLPPPASPLRIGGERRGMQGGEALFSPLKPMGKGSSSFYADPFAPSAGSLQLSNTRGSSFSPSPTRGNKRPIATTISSSAPAQCEEVIEIDGVSVLIRREGGEGGNKREEKRKEKESENTIYIGQYSHSPSSCSLLVEENEERGPPKSVLKGEKDHTAPPSPTRSDSEGSASSKVIDVNNDHSYFVSHDPNPPTADDKRRVPLSRLEPNNTPLTKSSYNKNVGSNKNGSNMQNEEKLWDELRHSTPTVTIGGNMGKSRHNVVDPSVTKRGGTPVVAAAGRGVNSTLRKASTTMPMSQRHLKYTKSNTLLLGGGGNHKVHRLNGGKNEEVEEEEDDLVIAAMAQRVALLEEKLSATLSERIRFKQHQSSASAHSPYTSYSTYQSISRDVNAKKMSSSPPRGGGGTRSMLPFPSSSSPIRATCTTDDENANREHQTLRRSPPNTLPEQQTEAFFVRDTTLETNRLSPRPTPPIHVKREATYYNYNNHTAAQQHQQHHASAVGVGNTDVDFAAFSNGSKRPTSNDFVPTSGGGTTTASSKPSIITGSSVQQHSPPSIDHHQQQQRGNRREERENDSTGISYHRHEHHHHIHLESSSTSSSPTHGRIREDSSLVSSTDLLIIKSSSDVRGERERRGEGEGEGEGTGGSNVLLLGAKALHDDSLLYIGPPTPSTSSNTHTDAQYGVPHQSRGHHHEVSIDAKTIVRKTYFPIAKVSARVANFIE